MYNRAIILLEQHIMTHKESDAQRWAERVRAIRSSYGDFETTLGSIEDGQSAHQLMQYEDAIDSRYRNVAFQLLERMQENFGPFTHNVLNTLYGEFESEEARQRAEQVLLADLSESPWSSSVYRTIFTQRSDSGQVVNPSEDPDRAGEQLRFLLKTYTPGKINPIGVIFEEESRVANTLR